MRAGVRTALAGLLAAGAVGAAATPAAGQTSLPSGTDYGGFRNVLPGGQGETVSAFELAQSELTGEPPATFVNQLGMYTDILKAAPALQPQDMQRFFKPAQFGVPEGDAARTYSPRSGVTVVRDRLGVPHVYGETSGDVAFGAGYVSAEDRLFLMDVLRHTGRARLTELIGPGENDSTLRMDAEQLKVADYSEEELLSIMDTATAAGGEEGARMRADFEQYVAGINQYIAEARNDNQKMPVEYQALGRPQGPDPWRVTDSVAVASLIGGIFGKGGGREADAAQVLQAAQQRFGRRGRAVFRDFRAEDDPERPNTTPRRFRFDRPGKVNPKAVALPDLGSIQQRDPVVAGRSSGGGSGGGGATGAPSWLEELQRRGLVFPKRESNVMLVGSKRSRSGRAFAIMGPQVGFYSPQILMEMDLHGGGYDARGASFPGISLYVLLGRGQDFSWSATTATTDNVDQFVEKLCNPDGSAPTRDSTHYVYKGRCIPFTRREYTVTTPVAATDPSPPRQVTFRTVRSVHGPIQATATVGGAPVAIASARSTYFHELESARAFKRFNFNEVSDPQSFQRAAAFINFAFNWFYVDDRDIGWLQSGWFPRRARGTDPSLPVWGTGEWDWQKFKPQGYKAGRLPFSALPKDANPKSGYIVNWNNAQAPGWRAADDVWSFGAVHRSQILEKPLQRTLRSQGKTDLTRLTQINIEGATVDLRGREVLPLLLRVMGAAKGDPNAESLVALMDAWRRSGAHRRDLDGDNVYDHSPAVAVFDEWWDRLLEGGFKPVLGERLFGLVRNMNPLAQMPPPGGSTWFDGWQGYVSKDLRRLLRARVRGPLSRAYCGKGSRARCRSMLLSTLVQAGVAARQRYSVGEVGQIKVPATCGTGSGTPGRPDGRACDQIEFTTAGAVATPPIHWQNRPTFQQAVEIQGHRPR